MKLSALQRLALDALKTAAVTRDGTVRASEIGRLTNQSPQGAAQTANALRRAGLADRSVFGGYVYFTLTARGWYLALHQARTAPLPLSCGHDSPAMLAAARDEALVLGRAWCARCQAHQPHHVTMFAASHGDEDKDRRSS